MPEKFMGMSKKSKTDAMYPASAPQQRHSTETAGRSLGESWRIVQKRPRM